MLNLIKPMFGFYNHRYMSRLGSIALRKFDRLLLKYGYTVARTGPGYIDAKTVLRESRQANCSICEYLEAKESDQRKRGRRDRIIKEMVKVGCLSKALHVIEIGAGTGMYLERVIEHANPRIYEVYETNPDWRRFLRKYIRQYPTNGLVHDADGHSLDQSTDGSADLIHAHGVFVYLSTINTVEYLTEMARACRPGGYIVFDCYLDRSFDYNTLRRWISSDWRFPVVTPEHLLQEFYDHIGLELVHRFTEVHGASRVDYEVLMKRHATEQETP